MSEVDDVCVVTHPITGGASSHADTLLNIIGSITTVSLVAVWIEADAEFANLPDVETISNGRVTTGSFVAPFQFLLNQLRMAIVLRRRPERTVLFFGTTAYLLPIFVARVSGKRVILQPRGDVPLTLRLQWERTMPDSVARVLAGLVRLLERTGFWLATDIITYTPSMAEELGLDSSRDRVHPNGARYVDLDRFYPRVPLDEREDVVGYLGRLDEEKGIRKLAAIAKGLPDDISFRFIGDGALRGWLEEELATEIAAGQVELTGWIDHEEVPNELSELKLLVMASEPTEGLPTTILEAMACGTPAYSTPVSGVPDVVRDGETGFIMEEPAPEPVVAEINRILGANDLDTVSENARNLITSSYNFDAAVSRYESILRTVSE